MRSDNCRHVLSIREQEGLSFEETSERFGVGVASLKRWSKRLHPKPYERRKIRKIDPEKLAQDVRDGTVALIGDSGEGFVFEVPHATQIAFQTPPFPA